MVRRDVRLAALICAALALGASARRIEAQREPSAARAAALASTLDSIRTALGATGASAAVILADGALWTGASGEAFAGTPVSVATVFDAGSITKSYTAALVLRLVERGVLALDDSVARWRSDLPGARGATIRDLLRQTSGIADYTSHPDFLAAMRARIAGPWPPEENLRYVGEARFPPGDRWEYSNTNYVLLGLIARAVTGTSYGALLRAYLLDSLGLTSTFVAGEETIPAQRAHAFLDFTGDGMPDDLSALVSDPAFTRGAGAAGAIVTSAADLVRFARAFYSGALVPPALRQEFAIRVDRPDGWRYGFAMIEAPHESGTLLGHLGNTAGQSAGVWHAPGTGVTVAVLSNVHAVRMDAAVRRLMETAVR